MPVFAVYKREADTCGNEDITGPIRYIQADKIEDVEEIFPDHPFLGYIVREIQIETVAWIKIQQQTLG